MIAEQTTNLIKEKILDIFIKYPDLFPITKICQTYTTSLNLSEIDSSKWLRYELGQYIGLDFIVRSHVAEMDKFFTVSSKEFLEMYTRNAIQNIIFQYAITLTTRKNYEDWQQMIKNEGL